MKLPIRYRLAALLTLMAAPTEVIGDIQRTYEYADALERQGDITAAAALRTETDLALASALSGAGGVARGAAVGLETLASTTGKLVVKAETLVAKGAPGAAEAGTASDTVATQIAPKIARQMGTRGWNRTSIDETISQPERTVATRDTRHNPETGFQNDAPATAYINADGSYVVKNDRTGDIVQVSDRNDPNWKSPFD